MKNQNAISSTTQQFLEIYDITNDLVVQKSGNVSLVISVTAMNFGLLAEEEQDAIIYGYAGLLNSLNYPIQIVIRSQTKDVTSYLNSLKLKEDETINRVRKDQIRKYREFVSDLVQERNVLDKKFYVVIPATALELGLVTTQSVLPGVKSPDISTFDRSVIIERSTQILEPKRDHLMAQFARIGLASRQLKTQELIQLFYTIYNPEASEGQKMTDSSSYTTSLVEGNLEEEVFGVTRSQTPENLKNQTTPVQAQTLPDAATEAPVGSDIQTSSMMPQSEAMTMQIPNPLAGSEAAQLPMAPETQLGSEQQPYDQKAVQEAAYAEQNQPQTQDTTLPPPQEIV